MVGTAVIWGHGPGAQECPLVSSREPVPVCLRGMGSRSAGGRPWQIWSSEALTFFAIRPHRSVLYQSLKPEYPPGQDKKTSPQGKPCVPQTGTGLRVTSKPEPVEGGRTELPVPPHLSEEGAGGTWGLC